MFEKLESFGERFSSFVVKSRVILIALGLITLLNLGAETSLAYGLTLGNLGIVSIVASLG